MASVRHPMHVHEAAMMGARRDHPGTSLSTEAGRVARIPVAVRPPTDEAGCSTTKAAAIATIRERLSPLRPGRVAVRRWPCVHRGR
jgi:hypothetical protein